MLPFVLFSRYNILIREGNGCFVNSNVLHGVTIRNREETIIVSHLFGKLFLAGFYNSIFEQKYISPVLDYLDIEIFLLDKKNNSQLVILDLLKDAYEIAEKETECYEFLLRNIFSTIWIRLLKEFKGIQTNQKKKDNKDTMRIKAMISFIFMEISWS